MSDETAKWSIAFGGCWVRRAHVEVVVEAWMSSLAAGKTREFRCRARADATKAPLSFRFHGGLPPNSWPLSSTGWLSTLLHLTAQ